MLKQDIKAKESPLNQTINIGGGSSKVVKQIYIGDSQPTDPNILIWIDTSGTTPVEETYFLTSDNKEFYTKNNEKFLLKEE